MSTATRTPSRRGPWLAGALLALPDRLVLLLFWTCLVVSGALLAGAFLPVVVGPALLLTLALTWRLAPAPVRPTPAGLVGALGALALTAAWLAAHVRYASQYVTVTRDPGFLTLEGLWLMDHPEPDVPLGSAPSAQGAVSGATVWTGAFQASDGVLQAQGAKLLPGLLALAGWLTGERGLLAANLAVGAVALVALYGLARRVVGPVWALLPVGALAASVPLAAFSRAAYTEPLTVALAFGGLTMAWSGLQTRTWWRLGTAGAMVGATALARIDGAASVIGLVLGLGLVAAASLAPRHRRRLQMALVVTTAAAVATVALGYLDLRWHSRGYLRDLGSQFALLVTALVASVVASLAFALPTVWDPARRWLLRHRRTAGLAAAATVPVVALVLVSRPLWRIGHRTPQGTPYANLVEGLQGREGLPIDPTRSYDEMSVAWLAWYHGWPMVVLAFAGLALMAHRAISRRDPRHLVLLAVIAAPSLLYLWRVSISPDHVWAMRRLLPVTIPGFLLAATVALVALWAHRRWWTRAVAGGLAATVLLHPATTWGSLFGVVEQGGRWAELTAVCSALPADRVVYVRGSTPESAGPPYLETLRVGCGVEVVQLDGTPTTQELAAVREAWGGGELGAVAFTPTALPWPGDAPPAPVHTTTVTTWSYALSHIPTDGVQAPSTVWVAEVLADGSLVPVHPDGSPAPSGTSRGDQG